MLPGMARPRRDNELDRIAEIVRTGAGRSPLYRWLRARHDAFAELLAEGRPDWRALAAEFAQMGLLGGDGQTVTAESARHTWWRVRRDCAKAQAKRGRLAPVVAVLPVASVKTRPPTETQADGPSLPDAAPNAAAGLPHSGDALARLRAEMLQRSGRKVDDAS
jgi:hypothetical protein